MSRNLKYLNDNRIVYRRYPISDKPTKQNKLYMYYQEGTHECYELFRSKAKITTYKSLKWHLLVIWYLNSQLDQDDFMDMYDDLIHEISHSLEESHGYFIYGDKKIEQEFLRKRKHLHDLLWKKGVKAPLSSFLDSEYDKEFDMFLYQKIGYDKLSGIMMGLFLTPYAATSLKEYFATGFTEFYLHPETHDFFQKVSPELYKKIFLLQDPEELDN